MFLEVLAPMIGIARVDVMRKCLLGLLMLAVLSLVNVRMWLGLSLMVIYLLSVAGGHRNTSGVKRTYSSPTRSAPFSGKLSNHAITRLYILSLVLNPSGVKQLRIC